MVSALVSLIARALRGVLPGMACAGIALGSSTADAATPTVTWWVDPSSCPEWSTPLARQIALACEAAGHACDVSADQGTRRIALQCGDEEHWTLEAHDERGTGLWHIEVRGDNDERLRTAALWVARSEGTLSNPPPPAPKPPPPSPPETPRPAPFAENGRKPGGLAMGVRGLYWPHDQARDGALWGYGLGLRVLDSGNALRFLPQSITPYISVAFDFARGGDRDARGFNARLGGGAMWHPSGIRNIFGLSLEAGASWGYSTYDTTLSLVGGPSGRGSNDDIFVHAFGGVHLEAPTGGSIRPYASLLLGGIIPNRILGTAVGVLEIGCRWAAW
ncbi:hypothetical protein LVJ94_47150 [Pendulispora rubella]|uniref:Uncharacterized protein n=1 Tax=Pendulispora rubella TaxID=2741070 RepID=A0ABZ2L3A9_9BACT